MRENERWKMECVEHTLEFRERGFGERERERWRSSFLVNDTCCKGMCVYICVCDIEVYLFS